MGDLVRLSQKRLERAEKAAQRVPAIHPASVFACECGAPERSFRIWEGGSIQCAGCNGFIQDMICIEHGGKVT